MSDAFPFIPRRKRKRQASSRTDLQDKMYLFRRRFGKRGAVSQQAVKQRRDNWFSIVFLGIVWSGVAVFALLGVRQFETLYEVDLRRVAIQGEFKRLQPVEIRSSIEPFVRGNYFTLKLATIRAALEQMDWVYSAQIKRAWPSGLEIAIVEQQAIAIWNAQAYMNADGELFGSADFAAEGTVLDLPRLYGPEGNEAKLVQSFTDMRRILSPLRGTVVELRMAANMSISAKLEGGQEIKFGDRELVKKMRQFLAMYETQLEARFAELDYVDFRYPNGAAVRWRDAQQTTAEIDKPAGSGTKADKNKIVSLGGTNG